MISTKQFRGQSQHSLFDWAVLMLANHTRICFGRIKTGPFQPLQTSVNQPGDFKRIALEEQKQRSLFAAGHALKSNRF